MKKIKRNSKEQYEEDKQLSSMLSIINKHSIAPLSSDDIVFNIKRVFIFTKLKMFEMMQNPDLKPLLNREGCTYSTDSDQNVIINMRRETYKPFWVHGLFYILLFILQLLLREFIIHQFKNNLESILAWTV